MHLHRKCSLGFCIVRVHTQAMRNPGYKPAAPRLVPNWHRGRATALEGPDISLSGRQILLGTLAL